MNGEKERFDELFKSNRDRVYRLCCLYTPDLEQRKDLLQEIFIRVWENMGSFRGESAISTWIYRIALNTCLTHVASLKKEANIRKNFSELDFGDIEHKQEHEAQLAQLIRSINMLEPADRTIIGLYLEDLSHREIAEIIGITEANARVKIHRIKQKLTEIMTSKQSVCA